MSEHDSASDPRRSGEPAVRSWQGRTASLRRIKPYRRREARRPTQEARARFQYTAPWVVGSQPHQHAPRHVRAHPVTRRPPGSMPTRPRDVARNGAAQVVPTAVTHRSLGIPPGELRPGRATSGMTGWPKRRPGISRRPLSCGWKPEGRGSVRRASPHSGRVDPRGTSERTPRSCRRNRSDP
jgi:hypothetical protein